MKLCRRNRQLWVLHHQGALSELEYNFCTSLLERPERPEWADGVLCWGFDITLEELDACRASLRRKGVLDFSPGNEIDTRIYRVLEPQRIAPFQVPPPEPLAGRAWRQDWIVFEQGARAHLMREGDLFPAERTLCGMVAINADLHPLARYNSQPADYPICRGCHLLRIQLPTS